MNKEIIIAHDPEEKKAICEKCKLVDLVKRYYFKDSEKTWTIYLCKKCANSWAMKSINNGDLDALTFKDKIKQFFKRIIKTLERYSGLDKNR